MSPFSCGLIISFPVIVLGDFKIDVTKPDLPASAASGFRSLASEASYDMITFRTKGSTDVLKTSFIDDILLSPSLSLSLPPLLV